MNLPELAHARLYAPLLAALELARADEAAPAVSEVPRGPEAADDDFEATRPNWFVSGADEESTGDGSKP